MDIQGIARSVMDARLLHASARPVAVALSGGGDSLALTLIADAWARAQGRELLILTVDHRLQVQGAAWTARCANVAARLGRPFQALAWEGDKPATGLPAAARDARHRLLANAARDAGAKVVLMGHTADDLAEAGAMRAAGSTTPGAREWSPSPVWPDGRGVFVLRPMLRHSRADLRGWLTASGETWIDDPANADPRYARSRARAAGAPDVATPLERPPPKLFRQAEHFDGCIGIARRALRATAFEDVVRFLSLACVCAGGGDRRPATARLQRLAEALRGDEPVVATLAGARIEAGRTNAEIWREAGEFRRRAAEPLLLPVGREVVWDGRYGATARRPGLAMRPVAGVAARLPSNERALLDLSPAARRGSLPAVVYPDGDVSLAQFGRRRDDVDVHPIVRARFEAAAGLVQREPV